MSSPDRPSGVFEPEGGQRGPGAALSAVPAAPDGTADAGDGQGGNGQGGGAQGSGRAAPPSPLELRLRALIAAARYHGMELDRDDLRVPEGEAPSPAALVDWVGAGAGLFNAD